MLVEMLDHLNTMLVRPILTFLALDRIFSGLKLLDECSQESYCVQMLDEVFWHLNNSSFFNPASEKFAE